MAFAFFIFLPFLVGVGVAAYTKGLKLGCAVMLVVPIAAFILTYCIDQFFTETRSSTSALAYIFMPLWATLAYLAGFGLISFVKDGSKDLP